MLLTNFGMLARVHQKIAREQAPRPLRSRGMYEATPAMNGSAYFCRNIDMKVFCCVWPSQQWTFTCIRLFSQRIN